jgi:hypothetical protein
LTFVSEKPLSDFNNITSFTLVGLAARFERS